MPERVTAILMFVMLSACGGGGGGPSVEEIRAATGSQPPLETAADQSARVAEIISRTDSLIMSTTYGSTSLPELPSFRVRASCSGTVCTLHEPQSGYRETVTIRDLEFSPATVTLSLSKNGITVFGVAEEGLTGYGAWMRHSAFQVGTIHATFEGMTVQSRSAMAGGDLAGSRPGSSATWRGVMVGTQATGPNRGDSLLGDARLTYSFSGGTIDARFASIWNVDRHRDHTVASVRFDDIRVDTDGTFQAGSTGNRIQGGFYGPGHAETAGILEQSGIVGSFGAKR